MTETLVPWKPDFNVKPDRCSCEFCHVMALLYLEMRLRWETPWREKFGKGLRSRYVRNRTLVVVPVLRKVATRITQMQGFLQLQPKDLVETSEHRLKVWRFHVTQMYHPQGLVESIPVWVQLWSVLWIFLVAWRCEMSRQQGMSFLEFAWICSFNVWKVVKYLWLCTWLLFCYSFVILDCCQVTTAFCRKPWLQKTNQQQLGTQLDRSALLQKGGVFACLVHQSRTTACKDCVMIVAMAFVSMFQPDWYPPLAIFKPFDQNFISLISVLCIAAGNALSLHRELWCWLSFKLRFGMVIGCLEFVESGVANLLMVSRCAGCL